MTQPTVARVLIWVAALGGICSARPAYAESRAILPIIAEPEDSLPTEDALPRSLICWPKRLSVARNREMVPIAPESSDGRFTILPVEIAVCMRSMSTFVRRRLLVTRLDAIAVLTRDKLEGIVDMLVYRRRLITVPISSSITVMKRADP